jgi:peptidoglycan/xylan/chitin deacetylase (PgdA/CDA1 family)
MGPLSRMFGLYGDFNIPILMYHSISKTLDSNRHPYFRTVTTPEVFAEQMRFLSSAGFVTLTFSEAAQLLRNTPHQRVERPRLSSRIMSNTQFAVRPRRPVVITFDDGFRDFYTTAFPILDRLGFKATVFLTSKLIDGLFLTGQECLKTIEIQELAANGIEFGSHTASHPQLRRLSADEIVHELSSSKMMIENIIASPVFLFSYPYGFPEEDSMFIKMFGELLVDQGYSAGVTTIVGVAIPQDDVRFLKRLPVNDCDDIRLFKEKLDGSYNWLHAIQLMHKKSRAVLRVNEAIGGENRPTP